MVFVERMSKTNHKPQPVVRAVTGSRGERGEGEKTKRSRYQQRKKAATPPMLDDALEPLLTHDPTFWKNVPEQTVDMLSFKDAAEDTVQNMPAFHFHPDWNHNC